MAWFVDSKHDYTRFYVSFNQGVKETIENV